MGRCWKPWEATTNSAFPLLRHSQREQDRSGQNNWMQVSLVLSNLLQSCRNKPSISHRGRHTWDISLCRKCRGCHRDEQGMGQHSWEEKLGGVGDIGQPEKRRLQSDLIVTLQHLKGACRKDGERQSARGWSYRERGNGFELRVGLDWMLGKNSSL